MKKQTAENHKTYSSQDQHRTLYRSTSNKIIAGVAGGLGEYFSIDPTIIRIAFVILGLFHGSGVIIYLIMWLLLPAKNSLTTDSKTTVKDNVDDLKDTVQSFAHKLNFKSPGSSEDSKYIWALIIIALGFFFLFRNFGVFDALDLGRFWPVILIVLGLIFIVRR